MKIIEDVGDMKADMIEFGVYMHSNACSTCILGYGCSERTYCIPDLSVLHVSCCDIA